jgi:hypothetical protein
MAGATYVTDQYGNNFIKIVPIGKGTKFNAAVTANTDIFGAFIIPTITPCTFRIHACFDVAGMLVVKRKIGGTTITENLNVGNPLVVGASYLFDILVDATETINLQYSVTGNALKMSIIEIAGDA